MFSVLAILSFQKSEFQENKLLSQCALQIEISLIIQQSNSSLNKSLIRKLSVEFDRKKCIQKFELVVGQHKLNIIQMNKSILILALIAISSSYILFPPGVPNCPEPTVVPYVNITQYLGGWYEQSKIPFFFEYGCSHTEAIYSLNPNGNNLLVNNTCVRNGKQTYQVGQATPQNAGNSKLKVQFSETFNIGAQYWIVMLDADYTYAVVSSPDYAYLWILYRQPVMPTTLYNQIVSQLQAQGCYQVGKLQMTLQ